MRLQGKVVLLTGAGRGIGEAAAIHLAREGAAIIVGDRNFDAAKSVAGRIEQHGQRALAIGVDVTLKASVDRMANEAIGAFGQVDALVNCAGGYIPLKGTLATTEPEWDSVVDSNLKGTFLCCQALLPQMIRRKYGRIVNMASLAGRSSSPLLGVHYTAAKAGVLGLTRHLAKEFGPHGITVNAIAPGTTYGPRAREIMTAAQEQAMMKLIPLGRLAEADDLVPVILFLASDESRYITGATVDVNGGLLMI